MGARPRGYMVSAGEAWGEEGSWQKGGSGMAFISSRLVVPGWAPFTPASSNIQWRMPVTMEDAGLFSTPASSNLRWRMPGCFSPVVFTGGGRTGDSDEDRGGDSDEDSDNM